jgi:hypothetical protein
MAANNGIVKLTVNLPASLVEKLRASAEQDSRTMTEVIRRGLETEVLLNEEEKNGTKVLLEKNDTYKQLVRR